MYKFLFLFLALALTALSACERDECPCRQGKQVEIQKPIPAPTAPDHTAQTDVQPKVDEFGEYITDGKHPKQRVDLTDHGAGFTYGLFGKMANISRERFDSLFTQTVWKYSNMRVVESDATLAKEPLKMLGLIINPETFTCRNGKVYLRNFDGTTGKYTITERAFYYDETINRLTFIGTDVSWEIIRLTPHAIEFLQHGENLWSPFDWYYFRRSPEKELKAD